MIRAKKSLAAAAVAAAVVWFSGAGFAAGSELTKEQAVEKALKQHPGKLEKAYKETRKGKEVWEVKIKGDDGSEHELYYDAKTGEPVK
jgi:uncharacterized membrane protein YkoI